MGIMQKTLIVVPCFNEEDRLDASRFLEFVDTEPQLDFLFINDGSTDNTKEILKAAAFKADRINVLTLKNNCGKAEAVRQGFITSIDKQFKYIGFWDADLATPLEEIGTLVEIAEKYRAKVVIGSRVKIMGSRIQRKSILRHYAGRVFATLSCLWIHENIYDTQCGAKVFLNDECLEQVFKEKFCVSWIFDLEVIVRYAIISRKHGRKTLDEWLVEVPLKRWDDVAGSKLRIGNYFFAGVDFCRLIYKYRSLLRD